MIRLLKCELMKTKHQWVFVTALLLTAATVVAGLYGNYGPEQLRLGWRMLLYQLPLINGIFLPLIASVTASRICGPEHNGNMLRRLCTVTERGRLYDAKLIFGLVIMLFCVLIIWAATVAFGVYKGFRGECPIKLYLLYLLFTVTPTVAIYIFQHTLSMVIKNQAVPFFVGVIGEFAGVFSMFLPSLPWLRRSLLWGYYGVLQFVGLYGWTKEDKYKYAHFDVFPADWTFFAVLIAAAVIMYFAGRYWFSKKEV